MIGIGVPGIVIVWLMYIHPGANALYVKYLRTSQKANSGILYPRDETIFPPEMPPIVFRWSNESAAEFWLVSLRFKDTDYKVHAFTDKPQWVPSEKQWDAIKEKSQHNNAFFSVIGLRGAIRRNVISGSEISFTTSEDSVGNPLFYREVILPFSDAVRDPSRIRWRFGAIHERKEPSVVLENLPVCGNCHSFSADGKTLGMDVDYANDKGAYAVTSIACTTRLSADDVITWSDYDRDENDPTFGLLSQVSPDGNHVVSTVKDRSVFVAKPDLAFSQLFFPIQGILAIYSKTTGKFAALPGADNPLFVQSNPSWSPDGKYIVFARSTVYHLESLHDKARAILSPEECSEFLSNKTLFKYDLFRIPFNDGNGGVAESLTGAAKNGMSNFFARYSPDGKWIVFCKASSFMLLQPDSRLYIIPSGGGVPRQMRCNNSRMNSWHSWSSNSRWLVFASKENTPYTQLYITHIDSNGNDAPAVLLEHLTAPDRAANIPEFVYNGFDAIEKIEEEFIDDVSLWRAGMSFEEAGDSENAYVKYLQALKLNPENVKAHISAGNMLEVKGKTEEALVHYTTAVQLDSTSVIARINVGNIYFNKGDMSEAIRLYSAALKLAPHNGFAHYNLADAYFKLSKFNEALEHFNTAMRLMPQDALTRFSLGKLAVAIGKNSDAISYFTEGVRLLPDDPDGYQLLADAHLKAGKREDAIEVYRKALQLMPENPQLRLNLSKILQ